MSTPPAESDRRPMGAVLVGGHSLRMGRDKARLVLGGRSLAERAGELLRPLTRTVVFVGGEPDGWPGPHLQDAQAERGPLAGVVAALRQADVLVLACDLPHIPPAFLAELLLTDGVLDGALYSGQAAGSQPLAALYRRSALPAAELTLASDRPSMEAFVSRIHVRRLDDLALRQLGLDAGIFTNLNHPGDYQQLLAMEHPRA